MSLLQFITSLTPLAYASFGVGALIALLMFRLFFDDVYDFIECLRLAFQPDILSLFRGEWLDSHWSGTKMMLWLTISGGCGFLAYSQLPVMFPGVFH